MDSVFLVVVTTFVIAVVLVGITFLVTRRKSNKKFKSKIEELDIEKNQLINVKILSEITKVRNLVKTDNLKHKLEEWDNTFGFIKDKMLPTITDEISEVDFLIDKHDYKGALKRMVGIELEIDKLRRRSQKLIEEIQIITNSEERNRALITKLKVSYRELQGKFSRCEKDYGELVPRIKEEFEKLDNEFLLFEEAMDNNDYVEVESIVIVIEEDLNKLKDILDNISSLLLMASVLIPGKIEETRVLYGRMLRDGYPMDYLNVEYNLDEIKKKIDIIMGDIRELKMSDINIELKTILDYFNSLFADFDKEKECKAFFKEGCKNCRYMLEIVNKVVYNSYIDRGRD